MKLAVLSRDDVRALLPQKECIEVMDRVFRDHAEGKTVQPLRGLMRLHSGNGILGMMPAELCGNMNVHGIKAVSVFPGNHGTNYDAHQGVVVLFEAEHGCAIAVLDGSEITAIRTAAASAVATRALASEDARTLGIIGAGIQARTHIEAIAQVRPIERVRVWSRNAERAHRLAAEQTTLLGIDVVAVHSARDAVRDASIICTVTAAATPVLEGAWVADGTHINAVGACIPARRELDSEAVCRARLFTDSIESLCNESGDYLIPLQEGSIDQAHVLGELGQVLKNEIAGRNAASDITLFVSLGLGIQDLAAARHVFSKAMEQGRGQFVPFSAAGEQNHASD